VTLLTRYAKRKFAKGKRVRRKGAPPGKEGVVVSHSDFFIYVAFPEVFTCKWDRDSAPVRRQIDVCRVLKPQSLELV
jgi:hypothetical protein